MHTVTTNIKQDQTIKMSEMQPGQFATVVCWDDNYPNLYKNNVIGRCYGPDANYKFFLLNDPRVTWTGHRINLWDNAIVRPFQPGESITITF